MICENDYCIYWEDNRCILDEIYVNKIGLCESCIYVSIPGEKFKKMREEQLARMEAIDAEL